ncbi:hypothetical protein HD596_000772 [Nonomuraea jabiensis]|uniref:Uncharacterized protein n=1 Tax=Nonomuraea jabiensis TaxID=882448 RepID=A0A7W9FYS7_9ACTN|nr:hypothetical protein [Nonomuraea jabiensis]
MQEGPLFKFSEWPNDRIPLLAAGVYTVWRGDEFLYAGMSGRGRKEEHLVAEPGQVQKPLGLWTRLKAHTSGRRPGDQFNIYICDRFVIPALTHEQQADIGLGRLSLDQLTRTYVHEHLSYRYLICRDGERPARSNGPSARVPCRPDPRTSIPNEPGDRVGWVAPVVSMALACPPSLFRRPRSPKAVRASSCSCGGQCRGLTQR